MKIIKHSNEQQKNYHSFTCKCGCEFQCEEDEFWLEPQIKYGISSVMYSSTKTFMTCCPECHKIVEDHEYDYINSTATISNTSSGDFDGNNISDKTIKIDCETK